ncbi:ABC transporter permease [Paenibacillus sp. CAA11]|uniref:ABC transporter permease n=1 Tax=Paenibacillus sp. CAA11 TaxID=1532905 RepID=UPI000D3C5182|nr:ABC transporter permease [Paenibacillus sp. CAA11]AWB43532.1 ABC transporter permease [Paenibacillus sp. CAA11]
MTFRQFAFNNIFRNKRTYLAHFFSSAFSVMIFFVYALLQFHPNLQGRLASSSETLSALATYGMIISEVVILIFSFLFLLYSVGSFLKLRKKEFGIFMLLGMSRKQLNRLVFTENLLIGLAAIIMGMGVGIIFSKLILLFCGTVLAINHGLPFYFPLKPLLLTGAAFLILFLFISILSSLLLGKGNLIDLIKAEDAPKPEPKASILLSLLAVLFIGGGYACVFAFTILRLFAFFPLLLAGVFFTILGTYFLYTQLSVYFIRRLKTKRSLFFRRINLLTFSELTYRMKDNAVMFFMVTIIVASSFTGIGTMLAVSDPGLSEMVNPYAFTYHSNTENGEEEKHLSEIETALKQSNISYQKAAFIPLFTDQGTELIKLSEYNAMTGLLGYGPATLKEGEDGFRTPGTVEQRNEFRKESEDAKPAEIELIFMNKKYEVHLIGPGTERVVPGGNKDMIVISDRLYESLKAAGDYVSIAKTVLYNVEDWKQTRDAAEKLSASINKEMPEYPLESLVLNWANSKQSNGIILIVSGLVGIVFFTFAASFTYSRLYADLSRDEQQYRMISKIGLSRKELRKVVTRQLVLMFFLPIVLAVVHSAVAFMALQQLIDYSMLGHALSLYAFFIAVQVVYYFITRWRYLQHMYQKVG